MSLLSGLGGQFSATDIEENDNNPQGAVSQYSTFLTAGGVFAPPGVLQISGFAYDYEGDNTVDLANEITDHWSEDNTAVQDHIGVAPVTITLKGKVSELTFSAETQGLISSFLDTVENQLTQADAYLGKYTPGATSALINTISQVQNITVQIEQAAARVSQLASLLPGNLPSRNKQQTAFAMLSALRNARVLFTVYTPFQVFSNVAITSIQACQRERSSDESDFTVSMKQLQFVNNLSQSSFLAQYGQRAAQGYQPPTPNGTTVGIQRAMSVLTDIF